MVPVAKRMLQILTFHMSKRLGGDLECFQPLTPLSNATFTKTYFSQFQLNKLTASAYDKFTHLRRMRPIKILSTTSSLQKYD